MTVVKLSKRNVFGISVRTKNANEMDVSTAKIGPLWGKFYQTVAPALSQGSTVYGVYYNYESELAHLVFS